MSNTEDTTRSRATSMPFQPTDSSQNTRCCFVTLSETTALYSSVSTVSAKWFWPVRHSKTVYRIARMLSRSTGSFRFWTRTALRLSIRTKAISVRQFFNQLLKPNLILLESLTNSTRLSSSLSKCPNYFMTLQVKKKCRLGKAFRKHWISNSRRSLSWDGDSSPEKEQPSGRE